MGCVYDCHQPGLPARVMSGIAVYPANTLDIIWPLVRAEPNRAWDVTSARVVVPKCQHTALIGWLWGETDLPPTFVEHKSPDCPRNALTLDAIPKEAVLFHRNKDHSLINLLAVKLGIVRPDRNFVVVLNVCNSDAELAIKNMQWLGELGGCPHHQALLAYDPSINERLLSRIKAGAGPLFKRLDIHRYPTPPSMNFVSASRHAFLHAAKFVETIIKKPFLWYEADLWPLKVGWVDKLQSEYSRCGKPFFGSVIPGAGHFNGTALWPADTFSRCPSLQNDVPSEAFDTGVRAETHGRVYDCSHLIQCAWVERGGVLQPHGSGELPGFPSLASVKRLLPTAVMFHRCKNTSLVERLREMRRG